MFWLRNLLPCEQFLSIFGQFACQKIRQKTLKRGIFNPSQNRVGTFNYHLKSQIVYLPLHLYYFIKKKGISSA